MPPHLAVSTFCSPSDAQSSSSQDRIKHCLPILPPRGLLHQRLNELYFRCQAQLLGAQVPVTKAVFLEDDSLREARYSLPIKCNLQCFLSIDGAAFNQLRIGNYCLGLKLKFTNRGFIVRVDDDDTAGIGPTLGLAVHKPLHYAVLEDLNRQRGSVVACALRPRGRCAYEKAQA